MPQVRTDRLEDGDIVLISGAKVMIDGKPDVTEGPGGFCIYRWANLPVIGGRHHDYPAARVLTIQGGRDRFWLVTRR